MRARPFLVSLALPALGALTLVACGAGPQDPSSEPTAEAVSTTDTTGTLAARAVVPEVAVYAAPEDAEPERLVPGQTAFGLPQTFLVLDEGDEAVHVTVPGRPNGAAGWVRRADVTLTRVDHALQIDLASRTLTWLDSGVEVLSTPVAIGADEYPTPTGTFFVTDLLDTTDDGGAYGPYAIGLSGRSEVLTEFAGGDGQIGIHGTDDPASIGQAVSHGCVRVANDVITQLANTLPLGTPVTIA